MNSKKPAREAAELQAIRVLEQPDIDRAQRTKQFLEALDMNDNRKVDGNAEASQ